MRLNMGSFKIKNIKFGTNTALDGATLIINKDELIAEILAEEKVIKNVDIELTHPGENCRIIHVMDAVEPRVKIEGGDSTYPGIKTPVYRCGGGTTYRMDGVAVITTSLLPLRKAGGLYIAREGILDLAGPNSGHTPFSKTSNVVVNISVDPNYTEEEYEVAIRNAGILAARYLAQALVDKQPDYFTEYSISEKKPGLKNVVYINQIESCGLFGRNYLYGMPYDFLLPTLIHPNEFLDGALVNSLHSHTAVQIPTYYQTNNPVIEGLFKRHGKTLNFLGVILLRAQFEEIDGKHRCANLVAGMAQLLGADGVVATWECAGNSFVETMFYLKACENMGIKTVLITYENEITEKAEDALFYFEPEVDAIVSTGVLQAPITYPKVDRVIGGDEFRFHPERGGVLLPADQELERDGRLESWCACNNVGLTNLSLDDF
ncbi:MAG: glycine reductase [Firmicutes bacterium]|nr:glycine reductase [Bacillota bacterium]